MSSTNELRARSWDGFHKHIAQVVHVRGGGWGGGGGVLLLLQSQTWINLFQQSLTATFSQYLQLMVEDADRRLGRFDFSPPEQNCDCFSLLFYLRHADFDLELKIQYR